MTVELRPRRAASPRPRRRAAEGRVELLEASLDEPGLEPGSVLRRALVNRLRAAGPRPVVVLAAPAGYGKTTLLAQWAARDERRFGWIAVEERDGDAAVLLAYVVRALGLSVPRATLPRVAGALRAAPEPFVLVLDDVHLLRARGSLAAIAALADHVPAGSALVLAGRAAPALPLARLRVEGRLLELGAGDLALSRHEAQLLLRSAGAGLSACDEDELTVRAEGWAAGLRLAALSVRQGGDVRAFDGRDPFVAEYLRSEHLAHLRPAAIRFLTRASILEQMSGALCDEVVAGRDSARRLDALAAEGLFVTRLDRSGEWYRCHRLFREFLRAELERREPELVPTLHRRAAAWFEAGGEPEAAAGHALAGGDLAAVARLAGTVAPRVSSTRDARTVERWLEPFADRLLARFPAAAVAGGWAAALAGRAVEAERRLRVAEQSTARGALPDGTASLAPWRALLTAALCRDGAERMLADADLAVRELSPGSPWRPLALLLRGTALALLGDDEPADADLADAAETAAAFDAPGLEAAALARRAFLPGARGDIAGAEALARQARGLVEAGGLAGSPLSALAFAASARAELRGGNSERARADLEAAVALRPALTHALPWHSVQTLLELARAYVALLDGAAARSLLASAEEILRRRPGLGVLAARARALRAELDALAGPTGRPGSALTAAELRLLPLLTTHLSFREIGERLYVSRNTVKTQAISVYRKLGVSSRAEAIARAAELGLVDAPVCAS